MVLWEKRLSFQGLNGLRRDVMVSDVRPEVYLFGENASCARLGHTSPPCDSPRFSSSCKPAQCLACFCWWRCVQCYCKTVRCVVRCMCCLKEAHLLAPTCLSL